jgi:pyruvate dehydrogenase E2 component (dihydrolipoamide acetyltransferase)
MPDVAADTEEGVLAAWLVEESAKFDAAQTIAYVETQDELFSVEAGRPGVLLKTLVAPGTPVEPGTPIGILGEPWEQVQDLEAVLDELGIAQRERIGAATLLDATVTGHRADPAAAEPSPAQPPLSVVAEVSPVEEAPVEEAPVEEAPVEEAPVEEAPVEGAPVQDGEKDGEKDGAVRKRRERSAHRADVSAEPESTQHHYLRARVRVDRLVALSARLERDRPDSSVADLVGRAVLAAHRQVPQLGVARLAGDAAATPGISVTYPGRFGVEEAAALVPPGQAAALAVGDVRDEPVIDAGAVVPGKVMVLTLSVAPGWVDDVIASRWLAVLVALLERPEWMVD